MKTKLFILIFSLLGFIGFSQGTASISEELVISIEDANNKIPAFVLVDISDLDFKNQTNLDLFCKAFTFDYQSLSGNFANQELKIQFNLESLNSRAIDLAHLNENFLNISNRMFYVYSNF